MRRAAIDRRRFLVVGAGAIAAGCVGGPDARESRQRTQSLDGTDPPPIDVRIMRILLYID
jgi:hypothetical protein